MNDKMTKIHIDNYADDEASHHNTLQKISTDKEDMFKYV